MKFDEYLLMFIGVLVASFFWGMATLGNYSHKEKLLKQAVELNYGEFRQSGDKKVFIWKDDAKLNK